MAGSHPELNFFEEDFRAYWILLRHMQETEFPVQTLQQVQAQINELKRQEDNNLKRISELKTEKDVLAKRASKAAGE